MTTLFDQDKTCFICGTTSRYMGVGSTNQFGPSDLDTRPAEMRRSTIHYWVQRCPLCGYSAPDIAEGPEIAGQVVGSAAYLQQRDDPAYPELANRFLCWAMIQEASEDYAGAGWTTVGAAWACDDARAVAGAAQCRRKAAALFRQVKARGLAFTQGPGVEEAVLADLMRRSRQFDEVEAVCRQGLAQNPEELVVKILQFQQKLAHQQDTGCYTVADVEGRF